MLNRAYSLLEIKQVDEDARTITGMATTPAPDRLNDVVEPMGAQFKLPIPLLWQHDASNPIGQVTHAKVGKAGIEIIAKIAKGVTAEIDRAWALIKAGLVPGLSIGFKAIEHELIPETKGIRFLKWLWLELSAVTIPANAAATITTIRSLDTAQRAASGQPAPQRVVSSQPARRLGIISTQARGGRQDENASRADRCAGSQARSKRGPHGCRDAEEPRRGSHVAMPPSRRSSTRLSAEVEAIDKDLVRLRKLESTKAAAAKPVVKAETTHEGSLARGGLTPSMRCRNKRSRRRTLSGARWSAS